MLLTIYLITLTHQGWTSDIKDETEALCKKLTKINLSEQSGSIYLQAPKVTTPEVQALVYESNRIKRMIFDNMKARADDDNLDAQIFIALAYNKSIDSNKVIAFKYLKLAADQGNCLTQLYVGSSYANGIGTEKNEKLAFNYFQYAEMQGHIDSTHDVAIAYDLGFGVEKNQKLAFDRYKFMADKEKALGEFVLAVCYLLGKGVDENVNLAQHYFQLTAQKSIIVAQNILDLYFVNPKLHSKNQSSFSIKPNNDILNFNKVYGILVASEAKCLYERLHQNCDSFNSIHSISIAKKIVIRNIQSHFPNVSIEEIERVYREVIEGED